MRPQACQSASTAKQKHRAPLLRPQAKKNTREVAWRNAYMTTHFVKPRLGPPRGASVVGPRPQPRSLHRRLVARRALVQCHQRLPVEARPAWRSNRRLGHGGSSGNRGRGRCAVDIVPAVGSNKLLKKPVARTTVVPPLRQQAVNRVPKYRDGQNPHRRHDSGRLLREGTRQAMVLVFPKVNRGIAARASAAPTRRRVRRRHPVRRWLARGCRRAAAGHSEPLTEVAAHARTPALAQVQEVQGERRIRVDDFNASNVRGL